MKKILLLALAINLSFLTFAQTVAFADHDGNAFTSDTLEVIKDTTEITIDDLISFDGYIKNFTANEYTDITVKREIIEYVDDSVQVDVWGTLQWKKPEDQLCWGIFCTSLDIEDEVFTSEPSSVGANAEFDIHNLIHYKPYELVGTTTLKYSIMNGDEVLDELVVKFIIKSSVGVDDKIAESDFSVYPNPCKDQLTIANLSNVNTLTISNILGQVVYTNNQVYNKLDLNMSNLNNGVYFVTILTNDNQVVSERIVKK